ncbi:MAG TPA: hypothetical protein DDX39_10920 [Bacteroidales bacterium]|nr:MAG: hypothetical protein A2W98_11130 [Bacteroidetes bacterium GWF2_33_38]OFY68691.1 MAG: hypothetical protein A2265_08590 [Bacteroidetes bacterium RIFOXYA12_FULL_33_9]HBF89144.1 hypothetical protein [Bacteroidales bacterium]
MKKILLVSLLAIASFSLKAQTCYLNNFDTTQLSNSVYVIAEDHNENMFFAYAWNNGGFTKYDGETWTTFDTTNTSGGLLSDQVIDIVFDYSGNMYIGTNLGISKFDGTTWTDITNATTSGGLANNYINDLMLDNAGNLWVAHNMGLSKFDGTQWHSWNDISVPMMYYVKKVTEDKDGNIWVAFPNGVAKYDGDTTWTQYNQSNGLIGSDVNDILVDNDGYIWFITGWNGISKFDGDTTWESFFYVNSDSLVELQNASFDKFGNLWLSKFMAGAYKYNGTDWKLYSTNEGIPTEVNSIKASKYGSIWLGTSNGVTELKAEGIFYISSTIPGDYFQDEEAEVNLYELELSDTFSFPQLMYTTPVMIEGISNFTNVKVGKYILQTKMISNSIHPDIITSYFNGDTIPSYKWEDATPIFLDYCATLSPEILMQKFNMPTFGSGTLSGYITYVGGNKALMGEPVPGAEITLEQEPDDEPICNTTTDISGHYEFVNVLEEGNTYKLNVDIPGFPMESTHTGIAVGDTSGSFNFIVDTASVSVNMVNAVSTIETQNFILSIYPNPFTDFINVNFTLEENATIEFKIFDQIGRQITFISSSDYLKGNYLKALYIDSKESVNGLYFMQIKINNTYIYKKLLLVK